ncbi:hypothetical protein SAMN04515665_12533 [Blastococcus sp. DSM 46786]|uniref:hypothetical protein n=1 Tax=Blastococcus sp. DSM 46786 TaxID=1798227 RepID=UPI0008AE4974|nr:hypothetical protein [Blastococcus sp. DSM 46786]SEL98763.1 hypothetical protein SAMN04515665_12533 [Blastococcus sp. DSM 46786]
MSPDSRDPAPDRFANAGDIDLTGLTETQLNILASMAEAMRVPVDVSDTDGSDLASVTFIEAMSNLLTLHHAQHEEPLNKKSFEYLFKTCLIASGRPAQMNPSPGDESWDIREADMRWSLKTEAAKGISPNMIRIEKLMEARWVRESNTPAQCAREVRLRLPQHMRDYDRILVLRAFARPGAYLYELVEVPKDLLVRAFTTARPADFEKQGSSISFGANFSGSDGKRIFRMLLDSSVEKIRLWYQRDSARVHGRWLVQVDRAQEAQQNAIEA